MKVLELAHFDECTERDLIIKTIRENPEMLVENQSFREVLVGFVEGTIPIVKSKKCDKYKERNIRAMQIIGFYKGLGLGIWTKDKEFTAAGLAYRQIVEEGLMVGKLDKTGDVKAGTSLWKSINGKNGNKTRRIWGASEYKKGLAMRLFNNNISPKNMEDLTKLNNEWINATPEQQDKFITLANERPLTLKKI